jgi:UPF0716 protein FxsA
MPLLLLALFILVPIAELYVIIQIGGAIGIVPTLALLVVDSILGTILLRSQGRAAWVAFNRALAETRMPAKEIFDGVLIIFGGALLLTPGFLTDIVGIVLLIPPTRAIVRAFLRRFVVGRFVVAPAASWTYGRVRQAGSPRPGGSRPAGRRPGGPRPGGPRPGDIEGSAEEIRDGDSLPPGERSAFRG